MTICDVSAGAGFWSQPESWLTVLGFVGTYVGLLFTYLQGRKVKTAADAAKKAAEQTEADMSRSLSIADLSKYVQITKLTVNYLCEGKYAHAAEHLLDIRDILIEVKNSPAISKHLDTESKRLNDTFFNNIGEQIYTLRTTPCDALASINVRDLIREIDGVHKMLKTLESKIKHTHNNDTSEN